jgi:hypothetical protein
VTIEQTGAILATAAPKGVVMVRDEIAGWLMGMEAYNPAGRAFWLEAYGGRPYRVERRKHGAEPIEIERLAVAVYGGTQPERLSELATGPDDGLFSRILWMWPNPVPFRRGAATPNVDWAIETLDRLRELDLAPGNPPNPIFIPLAADAQRLIEEFGSEMEARLDQAGGLLRSAFGKARGAALRLSLVLEWLWCCAKADMSLPPDSISKEAFAAAATLVSEYYMPMAERVFGDAGATDVERDDVIPARWIAQAAAIVRAVRHRRHPKRERDGGAAAASTGRARLVVRISRDSIDRIVGMRPNPEFRGVGLADDDRACLAQPLNHEAIGGGDKIFQDRRSLCRPDALDRLKRAGTRAAAPWIPPGRVAHRALSPARSIRHGPRAPRWRSLSD